MRSLYKRWLWAVSVVATLALVAWLRWNTGDGPEDGGSSAGQSSSAPAVTARPQQPAIPPQGAPPPRGQLAPPRSATDLSARAPGYAPPHPVPNAEPEDRAAALAQLQRELAQNPNDDEAMLALALHHADDGNTEESERLLRRALTVNPKNDAALGELLSGFARRGDFASGNRLIEELSGKRQESPGFELQKGHFLADQGKHEEAAHSFERAMKSPELREWALTGMAVAHSQAGDHARATDAYRDLVRGIEGKLDDARREGADIRPMEQHLVETQLALAATLIQRRDHEEASRVLENVASRAPQHPALEHMRGQLRGDAPPGAPVTPPPAE